MKTKRIEYKIAMGYGTRWVVGYAVDHEPKFCVRFEAGWVVDDWDTGFGTLNYGDFAPSKKAAIAKAVHIYSKHADRYPKMRGLALKKLQKMGLL